MARMEMDCNLKKNGQFFQVLPVYFIEMTKKKNDYRLFFLRDIT